MNFTCKGNARPFGGADSTSTVDSHVPSFGTLRFFASKICCFDVDSLARFFAKLLKQDLDPGGALLPTASFPDSDLQSHT